MVNFTIKSSDVDGFGSLKHPTEEVKLTESLGRLGLLASNALLLVTFSLYTQSSSCLWRSIISSDIIIHPQAITSGVIWQSWYCIISTTSLSQLQKVDVSGSFRSLNAIIWVKFYERFLLERLFYREYFMLDLILCMLQLGIVLNYN